jgi:hypothetical protein
MSITLIFIFVMFYLMIAKPELWLEWFVNRPYRLWGLQVSIVDKVRFRKATRFYALVPIVMAMLGLLASIFICLRHKPL